jgi:hypothetical protein
MAAEVVEHWLTSSRCAMINRMLIKPIEHNRLKGKPLSSQKGQAEAFFLIDGQGKWWILKKFHGNCDLDRRYLMRVSTLLPKEEGFACATQRQVLSRGALWKAWGYHYSKDLAKWLDGTILMPRIEGLDWAGLADELRDGRIRLGPDQRLAIYRSLTTLIQLLEASKCSHRDLSCGNVFVDFHRLMSFLIDFDSLYHPSLAMPSATTCGTTGYTTHLAWSQGQLDARRTWCEHADRYALALLNAEFLLVDHKTEATGEGGIFAQEELRKQGGPGLLSILRQLRAAYPGAVPLLESAIGSASFSDCPPPDDWIRFVDAVGVPAAQPAGLGKQVAHVYSRIAHILGKDRAAAPLWPAPSLDEMVPKPLCVPQKPCVPVPQVDLPPDPWDKQNRH